MATDEGDGDEEDVPFGKPLPPEDRLWRHPSELGAGGGSPAKIVLVERTHPPMARTLAVAAIASLVGAGAVLGLVLTTGVLVRERPGTTSHEVRTGAAGAPGESELAVANKVLDSVVHLEVSGPNGPVRATAVVFRSDGQLITTADAVDAADQITVVLPDKRRITTPDVTIVGRSIAADVAVLKVPVDGLTPAAGARTPVPRWTRTIVVDASPASTGPAISVGVVTRESAAVPAASATDDPMFGLIETTTRTTSGAFGAGSLFLDDTGTVTGLLTGRAEARPGPRARTVSSAPAGGPSGPAPTAVPAAGRPVAATTTSSTEAAGDQNTPHYAIPADFAWNVAAQLADTGQVVKPWVGLPDGDDLSAEEADRDQIDGGLRVKAIEDGSPARRAGVQAGDVIVALEKDVVTSYNTLVTALRRHKPNETVRLRVLRRGEYVDLRLTLAGKLDR
jgi:S1-C subfamily serine protease